MKISLQGSVRTRAGQGRRRHPPRRETAVRGAAKGDEGKRGAPELENLAPSRVLMNKKTWGEITGADGEAGYRR